VDRVEEALGTALRDGHVSNSAESDNGCD
jgi:hypothetical protein